MTKKWSSEILDDRRTFFTIFQRFRIWSENKLSPNFAPPIFMTMAVYTVSTSQPHFLSICLAAKRQTDQKILNKQTLIVESSQNGAVRYSKMNPVICVIYMYAL